MKIYTQDEVRTMLREKVGPGYSIGQMAKDADCSYEMARKTLAGERGVGLALPSLIGMRRKIVYVRDDA